MFTGHGAKKVSQMKFEILGLDTDQQLNISFQKITSLRPGPSCSKPNEANPGLARISASVL